MITNTLSALIELQEVDREIHLLKAEKASKPEGLRVLKQEIEALEKRVAAATTERTAYASRQRALEGEIADHDAVIAKYTEQMGRLKTNHEFKAMGHEIESEKAAKRHVEEKILEASEQIERVDRQIADIKAEVARRAERLADEESEVQRMVDAIDLELNELLSQRAEKLSPVPPEALAAYERLLGNYRGQALAEVENDTCTRCYSHLPLNMINRILLGEDFVKCPSCNRILYIR